MAVHRIDQQLPFAEFGKNSPLTDRLVFMALPDNSTAEHILQTGYALKCKHRLQGKLLRPERLHISLLHISDYCRFPQDVIGRAKAAASHTALLPPIEVVFDRVMSFSGAETNPPREDSYALALVARQGAAELAMLRRALAFAMKKTGIRPLYSSHFNPHLTLLYDKWHRIVEDIEPIRWTVKEFVLIDSLLGQTRYKKLGRWPLAARRPVQSQSSSAEKSLTIAG